MDANLIILLGLLLSFFLLATSSILLLQSYKPRAQRVGDRMRRLLTTGSTQSAAGMEGHEEAEDAEPLRDRVLKPILEALTSAFLRMLPAGVLKAIQERLDSAGNPANLTPLEFIGIRLAFVVGGVFFAVLTALAMHQNGMGDKAGLAAFLVLVCVILLPDTGLSKVVDDRRYRIRKALPDTIDLLVVCVEAGIGFDGAMSKVVEKSKGPLAEEFGRVIQEMRIGKMRSQSLRDMAKRIGVVEISTFVAAICQAEQTGASLSATLTAQAQMMRDRRSQRVREAAAKLPVKMLFPLVFCIFPAIFVVLLGPGIIQLAKVFGS
jgi:tight adherence protein C